MIDVQDKNGEWIEAEPIPFYTGWIGKIVEWLRSIRGKNTQ